MVKNNFESPFPLTKHKIFTHLIKVIVGKWLKNFSL